MPSVLTKRQVKKFGPRNYKYAGNPHAFIIAEVRYDDQCGNGHNTFSITGEIRIPGHRDVETCGCIHEDIAKAFPELAPLIKWHLVSSDGPMHYVANTMYHAGNRDCHGLLKDEFRPFFDKEGKEVWRLNIPSEYMHFGKLGYVHGDKPADVVLKYERFGTTGEGKERDLKAARSCAVWPDATDEELTSPDLKERLIARLPALLEEFRKAIESLGFVY